MSLEFFVSLLIKYLTVFGMSMLPIIELRGAVPYGVALDLPYLEVLLISIIGNMIPIPFIILFIRKIFAWMKKKSERLGRLVERLEAKAQAKGKEMLVKYETWGLYIFVAIPLPGTGAWTGALIAALFDLRLKNALPAIFCGVVTAGLIMTAISFGVDFLI